MLNAGLKPQTVLNLHRTLHSALKQAVRWHLLIRNPTELVDPPRVRRREVVPLDAEQARRLLKAAEGDRFEALYVIALTTGMRLGELLALKWADVDLKAGTLQVRRSVRRLPKRGFVEERPKSETSRRGLTLPPAALVALERHRERQVFERKAASTAWNDLGLVFCNTVGGYVEVGNLKRRSYWPILDRAGLPRSTRLHDLRHTVASLMLDLDENLKVVQEQLGHADISTTANIYGHLSARKKREAALRLGALLSAGG
jgi:integrase